MRSIRATLQQLSIDIARLKGRWLLLATRDVVSAEARCHDARATTNRPTECALSSSHSSASRSRPEDGDERTIELSSAWGNKAALRVTKL